MTGRVARTGPVTVTNRAGCLLRLSRVLDAGRRILLARLRTARDPVPMADTPPQVASPRSHQTTSEVARCCLSRWHGRGPQIGTVLLPEL